MESCAQLLSCAAAVPRAQRQIFGGVGRPLAADLHQAAPLEQRNGVLAGPLGKAGKVSHRLVAEQRPSIGGRRVNGDVDDERRWAAVVTDEVAHQHVDDIAVDDDSCVRCHSIGCHTPRRAAEPIAVRGGGAAMIKKLKFVGIPTANQERALAFWTDKIGFRIVTDQPMAKARDGSSSLFLERKLASSFSHLMGMKTASGASSMVRLPATMSSIPTTN